MQIAELTSLNNKADMIMISPLNSSDNSMRTVFLLLNAHFYTVNTGKIQKYI